MKVGNLSLASKTDRLASKLQALVPLQTLPRQPLQISVSFRPMLRFRVLARSKIGSFLIAPAKLEPESESPEDLFRELKQLDGNKVGTSANGFIQ